ncbi:MAG: hypothetical protein U0Q03_22670 [Acidimicrobiales bacterium]
MAWDSARPVPWRRLVRDWLVYMVLMVIVLLIVSRDQASPGTIASLIVISGIVFVLFGALLAKFGYQRKTLKQVRAESEARAAEKAAARGATGTARARGATSPSRPRPAPTKRTAGGGNRPPQRKKR